MVETQAFQASKKGNFILIQIMVAVYARLRTSHTILADPYLKQDRKCMHVRRQDLILQVLYI